MAQRWLAGLVLPALLAACSGGGEGTAGPPPTPASLRIDSGNLQEGVVGTLLPNPLVVTVLDANGRPINDARVAFDAAPGDGSVSPTAVRTNSAGRAETRWTLGTQVGSGRVTATVGGVTAASFTAAVRVGPVVQLITTPGSATLGLSDTLRLRATARDQFGNTASQIALAWSTLEPGVATVGSTGLVTAVALGNARIVVSAQGPGGPLADTVPITVSATGASFCGDRPTATPAIGGVVELVNTADGAEVCIGASAAGAEFALVVMNANPTFGSTTPLDVIALGVGSPPASVTANPALLAMRGGAPALIAPGAMTPSTVAAGRAETVGPLGRSDGGFEHALRARERRELAPLATEARAVHTERTANRGRAGYPQLASMKTVTVGQQLTLNAQPLSACTQANNRTGRVAAVSERAIVVADTENPASGYTDAEYAQIAATFDTLIYPLDVEFFGEPTDVSEYGKAILFYTRAVNQLTPAGANFVIGGFFFARDLYPRTARDGLPACATSNEAEMFYLLVPDPTGTINGNARSKEQVTRLNLNTIAHEFQHLINAGRRLYVTPGAVTNEEVWLDEGLSHTAEELLYFRLAGFTSRDNLSLQDVAPNQAAAELFSTYAAQNFARWLGYLRTPESQSLYAPNDSLGTRGASWHFLRYSAGRIDGDASAFYRQLTAGPQAGLANLTSKIPGSFTGWLRDWAVSVFADDLADGLAPEYTNPAWNFRSIFPALQQGGQQLGAYPLATRTLAGNVPLRVTLAGGGSSYLRFTVPPARNALLQVTVNGGPPPNVVRYGVVRYR